MNRINEILVRRKIKRLVFAAQFGMESPYTKRMDFNGRPNATIETIGKRKRNIRTVGV